MFFLYNKQAGSAGLAPGVVNSQTLRKVIKCWRSEQWGGGRGGGGGGGGGRGEVWSLVLLVPTGKLRFPYFIKIIPTNNHTFIFISIHYIMKNRNSKCWQNKFQSIGKAAKISRWNNTQPLTQNVGLMVTEGEMSRKRERCGKSDKYNIK